MKETCAICEEPLGQPHLWHCVARDSFDFVSAREYRLRAAARKAADVLALHEPNPQLEAEALLALRNALAGVHA